MELGARTLLGAPGIATSNKKLLGAKGIATSSKESLVASLLLIAKGFRGMEFVVPTTQPETFRGGPWSDEQPQAGFTPDEL